MYAFLLLAGALVSVGLVAGLYANRLGISHLLVFLALGIAAGVDGPLGVRFDSHGLAFAVGNLALAVILLDGGLRTSRPTLRRGAAPALLLATAGVLVTAVVVGLAAGWAFGMPWPLALLMGSIVASTDAAAVFHQLRHGGITLPRRLASTLEVESGLNDPVAVFLTLACIERIRAPDAPVADLALLLVQQAGVGLACGVAGALALATLLRRLPLADGHGGLGALLLAASGVIVFALTGLAGGSGFLAVYVCGVLLARRVPALVLPALGALDGYTWLAQSAMFLLLGLLATPHEILRFAWPALAVAATLLLLARPLAVGLTLTPLGFGAREQGFLTWVGLRGAVPIVLALYPVIERVDRAYLYFDVAFVVVVCSLLLQGPTLAPLARRLRLSRPAPDPAAA